jgi:hypothetical protein
MGKTMAGKVTERPKVQHWKCEKYQKVVIF